ncbi:MAG: VCBS repeat-containing protein [Armatimonadetes bacterium]|nr:VCBS repeat-containing protein [Armatimonadota bacterium]
MLSRLHRTAVGLFAVALIAACVSTRAQVTLAQPIEKALGTIANHVAAGDLNRDGRVDLAIALSTGKVVIVWNNGNGDYTVGTQYTVGTTPSCVAIGELTGDLYMDIAVANKGSNNVTVLKGSSSGTFSLHQTVAVPGLVYASNPAWLAIADMTNDGKNDIVTANNGDRSISVLVNTGTSFTATTSSTGLLLGRPRCLGVGDFNKDGKLDAAITTDLEASAKVFFGDNKGGFTSSVSKVTSQTTGGLAVGDLNNDSYLDLVVTNDANIGGVQVILGQSGGTFAEPVRYATFANTKHVILADLDWDGALDIVSAQAGTPDLSLFINNGNGTFRSCYQYSTNDFTKNGLASADMDNDGLADIVMIQSNNSTGICNNLTPKLESIALNPPTTAVGNAVLGTVNLNRPAPPEGSKITLTCTNPSVINVPTTFTVPAGQTTGTFVMAAQAAGTATVTGTFNRRFFSDTITVTPVDQPSVWPCDVNNDGKVDVTDITIVARMSGGLDSIQWTPAD